MSKKYSLKVKRADYLLATATTQLHAETKQHPGKSGVLFCFD